MWLRGTVFLNRVSKSHLEETRQSFLTQVLGNISDLLFIIQKTSGKRWTLLANLHFQTKVSTF